MNEIAEVLPESMKNALSEIPEQQWLEIEEVRIRINRPVELIRRGQPVYLSYAGTAEDAHLILSRLSNYSMYTLEEEPEERVCHDQRRPQSRTGGQSHYGKRRCERPP